MPVGGGGEPRVADPFDLTGRVAVLIGSTRGLGLASAHLLADHGAKVVVVGRNADGCAAAAAEINEGFAEARALGVACHLGKEDQRQHLIDTAVATWGGVD